MDMCNICVQKEICIFHLISINSNVALLHLFRIPFLKELLSNNYIHYSFVNEYFQFKFVLINITTSIVNLTILLANKFLQF